MTRELLWMEGPFELVPTPSCKGDKPNAFEKAGIEMALAHNMLLRGLNAIYKQAPWVQPQDIPSFVVYCRHWVTAITIHHAGEEKNLFPWIESTSGVPDLMSANKEQHESFHKGLEEMEVYVDASLKDKQLFDGAKLVEIIDGFGTPLREHLAAEIGTLLELENYGDKLLAVNEMIDRDGKENMGKVGITTGLVMAVLLHDVTWEDGKWAAFPPAPGFVLFTLRKVLYHLHSDLWRFSPCDSNARPQAQYAGPPEA